MEHNSRFSLSKSKKVKVMYSPSLIWVKAAARNINSIPLVTWPVLVLNITIQMTSSGRESQMLEVGTLHCLWAKLTFKRLWTRYQQRLLQKGRQRWNQVLKDQPVSVRCLFESFHITYWVPYLFIWMYNYIFKLKTKKKGGTLIHWSQEEISLQSLHLLPFK